MATFDIDWVRRQFPSLALEVNGQPVVYFDGPAGTQVPQRVIEAMRDYLTTANANTHGAFLTSRRSDEVIAQAHAAMADLLGCESARSGFRPQHDHPHFQSQPRLGTRIRPRRRNCGDPPGS